MQYGIYTVRCCMVIYTKFYVAKWNDAEVIVIRLYNTEMYFLHITHVKTHSSKTDCNLSRRRYLGLT